MFYKLMLGIQIVYGFYWLLTFLKTALENHKRFREIVEGKISNILICTILLLLQLYLFRTTINYLFMKIQGM